jgi:hypothetical protein
LIYTSTAFRGLASILQIQKECNVFKIAKTPSHTSLRRWINQVGYYKLMQFNERADDWFYVIDCSMRIENRKVLLILGGRSSRLKKGSYLTYKDLCVIEIRIIQTNSEIEGILEEAIAKTGVPSQISSDTGSDLMPSIRKTIIKHPRIKHVPDIMHKTGNMLKKRLNEDIRWKGFVTHLNAAKKRLCLSKLSFLCPPNIRGKSRFFNCQNVIDWANRTIEVLEELDKTEPNWKEMNEKLGWLISCKPDLAIFTELFELAGLAKEIVRKLHIGIGVDQAAEELLGERAQSDEGRQYTKEIVDFLKVQCEKPEKEMLFIGSSEIIESAFSKLKLLDRECGNSGFTSSILGLVACFGANDYDSIRAAFENCDPKAVAVWCKTHVGETIQGKRKRALKLNKKNNLALDLTRFIQGKCMVA